MSDDQLNNFLRRDRKERFVDYATGAVIMLIVTGLMALIVPLFPVALNPAPITVGSVTVTTIMPVCAGDQVQFTAKVFNDVPVVIGVSSVIYNTETRMFVPGSAIERPALPRPYASSELEVDTKVGFTVPDHLGPGEYSRVTAFVTNHMDTKPAFMHVPFTVHKCTQ